MAKRLFLLDGMALIYRAHFALAARPIRTSAGINTSALYGFANTLLDILQNASPTHLAVAFDTDAPTPRHRVFPAYKSQREVMPEELSLALPHVERLLECFRIPTLRMDGYEADDLIGTLVKKAEIAGFESFMVTADKDFGQLVTERTRLWKPGRQGSDVEVLGPAEVCARWGISRVDQVIDMLGLMGDTSDNIPGVPGVGEKTAAKLLAQYDTLEGVLQHAGEIKGRLGEALRAHREDALLSKQLATILIDVPIPLSLDELIIQSRDDDAVRAFCIEFEFNSIGRRLFGDAFRAGRGFKPPTPQASAQDDLFSGPPGGRPSRATDKRAPHATGATAAVETAPAAQLRTLAEVPHTYRIAGTSKDRRALIEQLNRQSRFSVAVIPDRANHREARPLGIAFSFTPGEAWYVPFSAAGAAGTDRPALPVELAEFAPVLANERITKLGHDLKTDLLVLSSTGVEVRGPLFDTMVAHALVEPDLRHHLVYMAEALLGYSPAPLDRLLGAKEDRRAISEVPMEQLAEWASERADVAGQLHERLLAMLRERDQERVFYEVEMPVLPVLVAMEFEGIEVDATALAEYSCSLAKEMAAAEADVQRLANREFNVNSSRQLGEVLFDQLRLVDRPRKTPTGQYATDEQTLQTLANEHAIVRRLLDYRAVAKLKSTYADALPMAISPATGRIHTTFYQAATATGRLSSADPNLQNIPIRTERGQEIRRAFVGRPGWRLLSADYSQIELRIIAALSREEAMIEAFRRGDDIHTATAARVFGVPLDEVTFEMRRRSKMVNYGIAYGISAFGLAQRLGIPRGEAAEIIQHYFRSYPGIRRYMDDTIAFARSHGWVETLTGRRRYLRDITSANNTIRSAAERNAINAPIQGTAADMIKIAMGRIHQGISKEGLRTRLLLQVHDELLFDLYPPEEERVRELVETNMRTALPLPGDVPIVVETGTGRDWFAAH
jgi:DNA polymerase-1